MISIPFVDCSPHVRDHVAVEVDGKTWWIPRVALNDGDINVELHRRGSEWVAYVWGKSAPILRPVPENSRPAAASLWPTPEAAILDLPNLLGASVQVVRIGDVVLRRTP